MISERLSNGGDDVRFALMSVVPDRRKGVEEKLSTLKTNRDIVVHALKTLVKDVYGTEAESSSSSSCSASSTSSSEEYLKLEKDVNRILEVKKRRLSSRTSSIESRDNPGSPFQNNPLLVSHDYAKSPMTVHEEEDEGESQDVDVEDKDEDKAEDDSEKQKLDPNAKDLKPNKFEPKDLLTLLRNIEREIAAAENVLKEENEKRKKHKIDDCRRVHDYDDFITAFLAMLAEQGMLADLVEASLNPTAVATKKSLEDVEVEEKASSGSGASLSAKERQRNRRQQQRQRRSGGSGNASRQKAKKK